jgi:hypothetical protein
MDLQRYMTYTEDATGVNDVIKLKAQSLTRSLNT